MRDSSVLWFFASGVQTDGTAVCLCAFVIRMWVWRSTLLRRLRIGRVMTLARSTLEELSTSRLQRETRAQHVEWLPPFRDARRLQLGRLRRLRAGCLLCSCQSVWGIITPITITITAVVTAVVIMANT